jgi:uncharacterized membrane protein
MNKKEILAVGGFFVSVLFIGYIFMSGVSSEISITLDSGKIVKSQIPATFTMTNTIGLMLFSIIGTFCLSYFMSDVSKLVNLSRKQKLTVDLLSGDEKKMYLFVLEKNECLQKDLIYELGFSKPKVTRVLDKLEQKKILVRLSYGKTNKIVVKD